MIHIVHIIHTTHLQLLSMFSNLYYQILCAFNPILLILNRMTMLMNITRYIIHVIYYEFAYISVHSYLGKHFGATIRALHFIRCMPYRTKCVTMPAIYFVGRDCVMSFHKRYILMQRSCRHLVCIIHFMHSMF